MLANIPQQPGAGAKPEQRPLFGLDKQHSGAGAKPEQRPFFRLDKQRSGAGAKPEQRPFFRLDMQRFLPTYLPRVGSVVGGFAVVRTSALPTSV